MSLSDSDFEELLSMASSEVLAIIARDTELSSAQFVRLATKADMQVAGSLLQNYAAPEASLRALVVHRPSELLLIAGHPNAPVDWKSKLPASEISQESLSRFLVTVGATKAEKAKVNRRMERDDSKQLGDIWLEVRPN